MLSGSRLVNIALVLWKLEKHYVIIFKLKMTSKMNWSVTSNTPQLQEKSEVKNGRTEMLLYSKTTRRQELCSNLITLHYSYAMHLREEVNLNNQWPEIIVYSEATWGQELRSNELTLANILVPPKCLIVNCCNLHLFFFISDMQDVAYGTSYANILAFFQK